MNYAPTDLKWDPNPEISLIEIASINDFNLIKIEAKPRILISRGGYVRSRAGISDNLASGKSASQTFGLKDNTYLNHVSGTIQVLIEARNEGTVERVTDLTEHFLSWSSPLVCDTQGFNTFGKDISISPCTPNKEDTEIFQVSLGIPWMKEERWSLKTDGVKLKQFLLTISPFTIPPEICPPEIPGNGAISVNQIVLNTTNTSSSTTTLVNEITTFPTYASIVLPKIPGLILVMMDETNNGLPTLYLFDGINLQWIPSS